MTTIVYRAGILASDSRAYSGGSTPIGFKQKIWQLDDGTMFGISTVHPGLSEQVAAWIASGQDRDYLPPVDPNFTAILVDPDGQVFMALDSYFFTGPLEAEYFAIGSGDHYAMGALAMGAGAVEAVEIAKVHDAWTDGKICSINQIAQMMDLAA
jgi:20S proteasome alpha/beta subunit